MAAAAEGGHPAGDPSRSRQRLPGLDALRGLAALAVVAFHYTTRFGDIFGHPSRPWVLVPWGQRGVEVFFVISGFVIQRSLERSDSARDFLTSRAVRLYPTFWAALAVTFTVLHVFDLPDRVVSYRDALLNLSMVPASLGGEVVDAVYWTLERELRFYGLVLLLLALGLGRYTLHALLLAVALQSLDTVTPVVPRPLSDLLNLGWAHLFAGGALLARSRGNASSTPWALLALCVASSRLLGPMQLGFGAGAVALVWIASRPVADTAPQPLVFLGKISYPLYLVHQYVGYVLMRALYAHGVSPNVTVLLATAFALAVATALHVVVEAPCLELLRRRRARESGSARVVARAT